MEKANSAEIAYTAIRSGILNGRFQPNERIKEVELVAFCGVSRTPVREALRRLAAEDFIELSRNHGARVKGWSEEDLDDLFSLRGLLEGYAASRAAERISEEQLQRIRDAVAEMDRALSTQHPQPKKVARFLELNRRVHETVWEAAGSQRLSSMLVRLVEQALVAHTAQRYSLARLAQSHHHHWELLAALEAADAAWAQAVMTAHIRAARQALDAESAGGAVPLPD